MAKAIIVYDSKFGNTRRVVETIAEGMREVSRVETDVSELKKVDLNQLTEFDAIAIG